MLGFSLNFPNSGVLNVNHTGIMYNLKMSHNNSQEALALIRPFLLYSCRGISKTVRLNSSVSWSIIMSKTLPTRTNKKQTKKTILKLFGFIKSNLFNEMIKSNWILLRPKILNCELMDFNPIVPFDYRGLL
jgi:site-specific DNA-adenine methylase